MPMDLVDRVRVVLEDAHITNASLEAEWIVQAVTGHPIAQLIANPQEFDEETVDKALQMAARRAAGEPLQYLTGVAGFRRLELAIGPGVFIPRPETEMVVERALELVPRGGLVVDVCTGSGAIALAVKLERPDTTVYATEASEDALAWAERNQRMLDLDVVLLLGDLLAPLPDALRGRVDVVVTNPPYVRTGDRGRLPVDVVEHEPHFALFAGAEGLSVLARIARDAFDVLRPGGWLVSEISGEQKEAAARLFESNGYLDVRTRYDLAGHERIIEGRRP